MADRFSAPPRRDFHLSRIRSLGDWEIETREPETSQTRDWKLAMSRGEISRAETGDYPGRAQKLRPAIASRDWRFASRRLVSIDSSGRRTSGLPPTMGPSQLNPGYSPGLSLRNRCYQTGDQRKQIFQGVARSNEQNHSQ